jgi:tetratricopeptide (TPR) repeat protein
MEQAMRAVKNRDRTAYCWTLANLGDMYGHAGRVADAYRAYLDVLRTDSGNIHALKGIAWIAYSHDGNTRAAKRILHFILSQVRTPELFLWLAEIAGFEGNGEEHYQYIRSFLDRAEQPPYGEMYNTYLARVYTDDLKDLDKAARLAEKEVLNRLTPETCDGLAWLYYNKGNITEADWIASHQVYRRTSEPGAVLHTAIIFHAAGKTEKAKALLKECLRASFELGPLKAKKIRTMLNQLSFPRSGKPVSGPKPQAFTFDVNGRTPFHIGSLAEAARGF